MNIRALAPAMVCAGWRTLVRGNGGLAPILARSSR